MNTALIVGGNGIIGRNLTEYLVNKSGWNVVVISLSPLAYRTNATYISMDLLKQQEFDQNAEILKNVTHIFFAAHTQRSNPYDQVEANMALLTNLMHGMEKVAPKLAQVVFIQGGKAYGAHLGVYKTPAKETDPRSITPNFYYNQEDFLRELSKGKTWSWTSLRPDIVIGFTVNTPMNLSNLIAVYAAICKEEGIPMRFPGSAKAYEVLVNVTGTDVLSKSMEWAALRENTRGEIFNVTNGDVFRWRQAWKAFGDFFKIDIAEPQTFSLQEYMPGKEMLWEQIVQKYGLQTYRLDNLVQWAFGDFIFNVENDSFFDVNKARRFGFQEMNVDSIEYMIQTFKKLRAEKIVP